jgi:hypothetical protein
MSELLRDCQRLFCPKLDTHTYRTLIDNIGKKESALFGSGLRSKGLLNGIDVIVNGLGHANDHNFALMLLEQIVRKHGRLSIGIVAANGMQDVDLIFQELLGSDFERRAAFFHVATANAVGSVGELYK